MLTRFSLGYFLLRWVVLLMFVPSFVAAEPLLSSVEISGNKRIDASTILAQVSSKERAPLNRTTVQNDIKEIYRTGLFDQVSAEVEEGREGAILRFQVVEKPAIRNVYIEGNQEVSNDQLKEQLGLEVRRFLDHNKIQAGIDQTKTFYQGKGYYGTEITFSTDPAEENQVDLTFHVKEGEKKRLREIVFEGNTEIPDDELNDVIKTGLYKWWSSWATGSGVIKEENLQNDVRELTRLYLNHGYVDVKVGEPVVEETEKGLRITYKISEGVIYNLSSISVEGDLVEESEEKTLEKIESKINEPFNVDIMRRDTFLITEKFTDVGYAFANVEPDTTIDRENRTVKVVFRVNKGSLVSINRINISGNQKTQDNVIRRSLKIEERELFSSSKLKQSEQQLKRLGYFDEVTITPEPTSAPGEIDLNLSVREGQTGTFSVGAGVSSGEGFIFNARISEQNIFGSGNSLTLQLDNGSERENYVLSFDNPRVNDTRMSYGFDLLSVEREFDDFDRHQAGGKMTIGYPLWFLGEKYLDDVRFALDYELLRIKISNVDFDAPELIRDEEGTSTSSSMTPRIMRTTIDNPLNPTEGSNQRMSVELAGLGGDEEFWLFQANNTFYYPLYKSSAGPIVFANRIRFGYGETFNDDDFPLFRRFFPGGIDSVRGFDSRELGPKDEQGNEYGGSKELIGNVELIFPLVSSVGFRGLLFYDVGNAFDDDENIELSELRHAVGWGFRWSSPLGPIRIEFGYPLDKEEGEKSMQTHFSFGAPL